LEFNFNILNLKASRTYSWRLFALLILIVIGGFAYGQTKKVKKEKKKKSKIEILHANDLFFDEENGVKAKRLIGDVRIKYDKTIMTCDSAFVYSSTNSMKAYSRVHITDKEGGMELFGDSLKYNGETRLTEVRGKVKVITDDMELSTRFLDYDRLKDYGYYWNGGVIYLNGNKDTLTSQIGHFYNTTNEIHFKDSVRLRSEDYNIESDTMHHNTRTERTKFFGPTTITSDANRIYTEKGWTNNKSGESEFTKNSFIITDDQQIWGDSILYNQKTDLAEMFCNVTMLDTINEFIVQGDYVLHNQKDSTTLVIGMPLMTQIFDDDSLFLHADTLYSEFDSTRQFRRIRAHRKAQFYKSDMQGKCDSLVFRDEDSSIVLFYDPILWSDANQITADFIQIFRTEGRLDRMVMNDNAFINSLEDSTVRYTMYNQIKGDSMIGIFDTNALRKVFVRHSGIAIYWAKEDTSGYIGMNKANAEFMTILLDSSAVEEIILNQNPTATLYPIKDITPRMQYLKKFEWRGKERPNNREDVYNWREKEAIKEGD